MLRDIGENIASQGDIWHLELFILYSLSVEYRDFIISTDLNTFIRYKTYPLMTTVERLSLKAFIRNKETIIQPKSLAFNEI